MNPRILCIEDDEDIALAVRMILRRAGLDVIMAPDGREGMEAFHAEHPDLVLLDLGLPVLDGWEVLERIRAESEVPVLIFTAHSLEANEERGAQEGADGFLTKPFNNTELVTFIQTLIQRTQGGQQPGTRRKPGPKPGTGPKPGAGPRPGSGRGHRRTS
jgi:DNA-binding response OmpR family regulator